MKIFFAFFLPLSIFNYISFTLKEVLHVNCRIRVLADLLDFNHALEGRNDFRILAELNSGTTGLVTPNNTR